MFQSIEKDGSLPNLFYKVSISLTPKCDKHSSKENYILGGKKNLIIRLLNENKSIKFGTAQFKNK